MAPVPPHQRPLTFGGEGVRSMMSYDYNQSGLSVGSGGGDGGGLRKPYPEYTSLSGDYGVALVYLVLNIACHARARARSLSLSLVFS